MGTTLVVYQLEKAASGTHLRSDFAGHEDPFWVRAALLLAAFFVKRKQRRAIEAFIDATTNDQ